MVLREIETNRNLDMAVVGFMDDNPRIQRRKIRGYPVFGGLKDFDKMVSDHDIKEIIIAFKENSSEKKREIKRLCEVIGAEVDVKEMRLTIK